MNAATAAAAAAAPSTPAAARRGHGDARVAAAILVTTLLWSSAFVAIRSARLHYAPAPMALGRLLVACVALSALMAVQRAQGRRGPTCCRLRSSAYSATIRDAVAALAKP